MTFRARGRTALLVVALVASLIPFAPGFDGAATADGSPDIGVSVAADAEVLHGLTSSVEITASNNSGTDGYNLSYRVVLPVGVSYSSGPIPPTVLNDVPTLGETTLFFSNYSDLPDGGNQPITIVVAHDPAMYTPGDIFTVSADAYVNDDERIVPKIDNSGVVTNGPGFASGSDSTEVIPFQVTKTEPSPENELLRGLHDQQTVYSITITTAPEGGSSDFAVEDWIPAGIEFLGCGGVDNSTVGEEYPGSGPIGGAAVPDCPAPTLVETINTGLPPGLPAGTYTHVVWDNAALASVGADSIGANSSVTFNYAAAIPMFENTTTWAGSEPDPTSGLQASNIDNNNGPSTAEGAGEIGYTNYVDVSGTYSVDAQGYSDDANHTVTAEDLAIVKTVNPTLSVIGTVSTWTLTVRTSEYAAGLTGVAVEDTVPNELCAGATPCASSAGAATPPYTSFTENGDGTATLQWTLGDLGDNATSTITYYTEQRTFGGGSAVSAGDGWTNDVTVTGTNGGVAVADDSSASQRTVLPEMTKEIAVPGAIPMVCGDGSALSWEGGSSGLYQPGDRVCFRLAIDIPQITARGQRLVDFLPPGFTYESWAFGQNNTVTEAYVGFDGSGAGDGVLIWFSTLPDSDFPPGDLLEIVVSTFAGPPAVGEPGDLLENLAKYQGVSTDGEVYFSRDDADVEWGEPSIETVDKSASATTVVSGDVVDFQIDVTNDGNAEALNSVIWDVLPVGLECGTVSSISDSGVCQTGPTPDRIEWTIPSIGPGATETLTYQVTIPLGVTAGESWTNEVGVRSYQGQINTGITDFTDYFPANNIDDGIDPADENAPEALDDWTLVTPDVVIDKSGTTSLVDPGNNSNGQATIGEQVFFEVEVDFPGDVTLYNPSLTDVIEPGYVYQGDALFCVGPSGLPDCTPALPVSWDGTQLEAIGPAVFPVPTGGETLRMTFSVIVDDMPGNTRGTRIDNDATVTWEDVSGSESSLTSSHNIRVTEPNLVVDKTSDDADGIVDAGQTVTWTIDVLNDGTPTFVSSAYDLEIWDRLPANLACGDVSNISDGGQCQTVDGEDYVIWTPSEFAALGEVTRNNSVSVSFDVTIPSPVVAGTPFTNTVNAYTSSLGGTDPNERSAPSTTAGEVNDSGPVGYFATDDDTLISPGIDIAKTVTPTDQTVGEGVEYTLEVTIPAGVVGYDLTVIDAVPAGVVVTSPGYTTSSSCDMGGACVPSVVVTELLPNGSDIGWFLGDQPLPAVADRVITIVYEASIDDVAGNTDGTTLTNTATIYTNQSDQMVSPPGNQVPDAPNYDLSGPSDDATVTVLEPDVSIVKEVWNGSTWVDARRAVPNESLDYRLILTNDGTWPAYGLVVTDTISTFSGDAMVLGTVADGAGYTVSDGDPSDGSLAWLVDGPLAGAGASLTITYTLDVWDADSGDEDPTGPEITNTAALTEYWAVPTPDPTIHREYSDGSDSVDIELDLASLGDYVWFDVDNDGVQDAGEPPLENVEITVTYLGADGVAGGGDDEVTVVTTDVDGLYLVEDLPGGNYTVAVTDGVPSGMAPSFDWDDGTTSPDGIWIGALGEAEDTRDIDFGYTGTGSVGDHIWFNRNGDGVVDVDEPGIPNITGTVTWLGFDDSVGGGDDIVYPFTTDANGDYLVDLLPGGEYVVTVTGGIPAGIANNFDADGGDDDTSSLTLGAGEDNLDQDFGYAGDSSIGDLVWHDDNRNGVLDGAEAGLANVEVDLLWPGFDGILGTPDDDTFTVTTDGNGAYLFEGLNPGDYTVTVNVGTVPAGFVNTFDEDGNLDDTVDVTLPAATDHLTVDFGYDGDGSIGDTVYWDLNGDGTQQPGEPGIPGVNVFVRYAGSDGILNTTDDVVYVHITDGDGEYLALDLAPGLYSVMVSGPVTSSGINTGDPDGGGDSMSTLTLAPSDSDLDQDFGYSGDAVIGDFVWYDINGDGVQDAGEPGLDGVDVELTYFGPDGREGTADDLVFTTTTAGGGLYEFDMLPGGDYIVSVDTSTLPGGTVPTFDRDGSLDDETPVTLTLGDDIDDADFGYTGSGEIGDYIWWDLNADGVQDVGEPGWPGIDVTVTYLGVDGTFGTADDAQFDTTTDADGGYLVQSLVSGMYRVVVDASDLPPDVEATYSPGIDPFQSEFLLGEAESNLEQDFGYTGTNALGDYVWLDANADANQDVAEPGADDVTVEIAWAGLNGTIGDADDITITTLTAGGGIYGQGGLVDGVYEVRVDTATFPAGWEANSDLDGGDPTLTTVEFLGGNPLPDAAGPVAPKLAAYESRDDVDFGLISTATLSGNVWHDVNADTINDALEFGLPNVTVTATWQGPAGDIDFVFTTDALGNWQLLNAPPGDYSVVADETTVPAGYINTTPIDVAVSVPAAGEGYVEHGFVGPVTIGSLVWVDDNGNGILDGSEQGIAGVAVELVTSSGSVFTVTDAAGQYLFTDQLPGTFTVRLDPDTIPDNLVQTYSKDGVLNLETTGTVTEFESVLDVNFGFQEDELPVTGGPLDRIFYLALALIGLGLVAVLPNLRRYDG